MIISCTYSAKDLKMHPKIVHTIPLRVKLRVTLVSSLKHTHIFTQIISFLLFCQNYFYENNFSEIFLLILKINRYYNFLVTTKICVYSVRIEINKIEKLERFFTSLVMKFNIKPIKK